MAYAKPEQIYNLDGNTQLEFLDVKKIIIIDKDQFFDCKKLMLDDASDADFAEYLNIPEDKVKAFRCKMQAFEDGMYAKRRASKMEKKGKKSSITKAVRKREISSEERFRRARELISRNLGTNQISKILKVSERSVTRFKRRMREEKLRLRDEGKIEIDPNDPDDENSFKHLPAVEKLRKIKELFRKRLKIQEISETLLISERSVRRWKEKLDKANKTIDVKDEELEECESPIKELASKRPVRIIKPKLESDFEQDSGTEQDELKPVPKKRRLYVDREKVQYARELIENGLSNKEMSKLLEMTIACVRKLKMKILNGTVEELIDNSEEHYTNLGKKRETNADPDADPLNVLESYYATMASNITKVESKPKVVLGDRDMFIARLLREHEIRTMDIAKLMEISERSVTRLISKSKLLETIVYDEDVVAEVQRMMEEKEQILNADEAFNESEIVGEESKACEDSKRQLGVNLLSMNVKIEDIAKMLVVSETMVEQWQSKMVQQSEDDEYEIDNQMDEDSNIIEEAAEDDDEIIYEEIYEEFE